MFKDAQKKKKKKLENKFLQNMLAKEKIPAF